MHDWVLVYTSGPQKDYKTYYRVATKSDDTTYGPCIVYAWVNRKTNKITKATMDDVAKSEAISTHNFVKRYGNGRK